MGGYLSYGDRTELLSALRAYADVVKPHMAPKKYYRTHIVHGAGEMYALYDGAITHIIFAYENAETGAKSPIAVMQVRDKPYAITQVDFSVPFGMADYPFMRGRYEYARMSALQFMLFRQVFLFIRMEPPCLILPRSTEWEPRDILHDFRRASSQQLANLFSHSRISSISAADKHTGPNGTIKATRIKFFHSDTDSIFVAPDSDANGIGEIRDAIEAKYELTNKLSVLGDDSGMRAYTNICSLYIMYHDAIYKLRTIFMLRGIRSFQRLWKKWWYEPDESGYARYASRMYDLDRGVCK